MSELSLTESCSCGASVTARGFGVFMAVDDFAKRHQSCRPAAPAGEAALLRPELDAARGEIRELAAQLAATESLLADFARAALTGAP